MITNVYLSQLNILVLAKYIFNSKISHLSEVLERKIYYLLLVQAGYLSWPQATVFVVFFLRPCLYIILAVLELLCSPDWA